MSNLAGLGAILLAPPPTWGQFVQSPKPVSVAEFGAIGDGRTNDRVALRKAFAAAASIYIPDGEYFLGTAGAGESIFDQRERMTPMTITTGPRVRFILETREPSIPNVFVFAGGTDVQIGRIEIEDRGGDINQTWRGANGILLVPGESATRSLRIDRILGRNLTTVVAVRGGSRNQRVSGITIRELIAENCYYGVNCQENGDDVEIGMLTALRCRRSYFVYGVSRHNVSVVSREGREASADVLIKRYRFNTRDITVNYRNERNTPGGAGSLVVLEHQPVPGTGPGTITNVQAQISVLAPASTAVPFLFRAYPTHGGKDTLPVIEDRWENIVLGFGPMSTKAGIYVNAESVSRSRDILRVTGTSRSRISAKVMEAFDLRIAS